VDKVGVNPRWQAVATGGVSVNHFVDPWPERTQLTVVREKNRHPARGSLLLNNATGFGQVRGVLVGPSTAKVDGRHVAGVLR
jgi:hypothetical protein